MDAQPPTPKNCTALILAGGRGRRFGGRDKALLLWHGRRFVDHQLERLRPQVGRVQINRRRDQPDPVPPLPLPVCRDRWPEECGPLAGIHAGLSQLATPWLLVVPCDAPRLPAGLFERLSQAAPPEIGLRYAHDGQRDQYLFALLSSALLPTLEAYLQRGGRAVRDWYAQHRATVVDCSDWSASFTNINDSAGLRALDAPD